MAGNHGVVFARGDRKGIACPGFREIDLSGALRRHAENRPQIYSPGTDCCVRLLRRINPFHLDALPAGRLIENVHSKPLDVTIWSTEVIGRVVIEADSYSARP